ncbi:NlpC/P60 family protein [Maricaulis maris]|uniref:NlpC/P60 family protein n=1 Tax=Maricaulis maris TaxID=74318 RepID=UPI003B8E2967
MSFPCVPPRGWHVPYLGIPFRYRGRNPASGWDCWGLNHWCLANHFGVEVDSHAHSYSADLANLSRRERFRIQEGLINHHREGWREADPCLGASLLFRIDDRPVHVGLYLGNGNFLHTLRSTGTVVESLSDETGWNGRLEGYFVPA